MPRPGRNSIAWVRELARPYLRGYRTRAVHAHGLRGYEFICVSSTARKKQAGFFVGYLLDAAAWPFLAPEPPECLVFAFVRPTSSALHKRLVSHKDALVRRTFEYIRWLTHRPPRFQFFESELPALVRHRSMNAWPREKHEHYSRNFLVETLAWLVRSGLVRKLAEEAARPAQRRATRRAKTARSRAAGAAR